MTAFQKLNHGWNAEPNAPDPLVKVNGADIVVSFLMNPFQHPEFSEEDIGKLRFHSCSRYRLGRTNDEGWYRGQCRFSKLAPSWGEFYEVSGDLRLASAPADWILVSASAAGSRHFLFYFRDDTFECDAHNWSLEVRRPEASSPSADKHAGKIIFRAGLVFDT